MSRRRLLNNTNNSYSIPTDGLVSEWKLEETTGTTFFDSVGTNNGTQSGISGITTTGKVGNGFYWGATGQSNGVVNYSTDFILNDGTNNLPFSFTFWVKPTSGSSGRFWLRLLGGTETFFFGTESNFLKAKLRNQNGTIFIANTDLDINTEVGNWLHFAITFDPNDSAEYIKSYKNGSKISTSFTNTLSSIAIQNHNFYLGGLERAGIMDEIKYYKKTLSISEIQSIYNSEL